MATADRNDPYRSYFFSVEIEGLLIGGFSEVSGLNVKREMVEYRNGNAKTSFTSKLMGRDTFDNITLKRGYVRDNTLWAWYASQSAGNPDRKNLTITLNDEARNAVISWGVEGAWIVSLMGPSFNAMGNDVAMESVELAVENVTMQLEGAAV